MNVSLLAQQSRQRSVPYVSVIVPLFNEAGNINLLYRRLRHAMDQAGYVWEVIFIDDGSTDGSFALLQQLHKQNDEHVRVVRLRRNYGQTAALAAGFDAARGATIVCLDGDLQNDPEDIARLGQKLDEGYDAVSGWRVHRQESFWLRRLPSRVANWLISRTTGVHSMTTAAP
jgi:glycosyltransferase involved in cell wall biosynthesis